MPELSIVMLPTDELVPYAGNAKEAGVPAKQELCWVKNHFTLGRSDYQWMHEPCLYGWKPGATHYFAPTRAETTIIDDTANLKKMSKADLRRMLEEILQGETQTTVLRYDKPLSSADHPTMKPVPLFARLIRNSSRRGDAVLDLFGGSGTTAIACEQMGRDAYLIGAGPRLLRRDSQPLGAPDGQAGGARDRVGVTK